MSAEIVEMPKLPCSFCKKREATQLCDFVVDYYCTTAKDNFGRQHSTCDNEICKECAKNVAGQEFCPTCKELYDYVQAHHVHM